MKAPSIAACTLALGCIATAAASAGSIAKAGATATIVDSGSTNAAPFAVTVSADGRVRRAGSPPVTVAKETVKKFFADVRAAQAKPSPSGAAMCFKSASFGSVMRVQSGAWSSVDLNCPVVGANAALKADAARILASLHLPAPHRITLPPTELRRMPNETPPTPRPAATP